MDSVSWPVSILLQIVFWGGLMLLFWTYAGYALALRLLAGRSKAVEPGHAALSHAVNRSVALVMAVRNEEVRIREKLVNLAQCRGIDEIILVCDHCADGTAAAARSSGVRGLTVIEHESGRPGKAGALNCGVAAAKAGLILFNDVRQVLHPEAVVRLAHWFEDERTGAVSGSLDIAGTDAGAGQGLDAYWSLEKKIRHWESELDSSIGCTGAIYMIRRDLFEPLPEDTLLDDVVVPMQIANRGFRVRFDPSATALDPQPLTGEAEVRRKTRTLAGNFQMLARHPGWMLPWGSRLWWMLISHKYLRLAGPPVLLAVLLSSGLLAHTAFYAAAFAGQVVLWVLAALGMALSKVRTKALSLPAGFAFLQISVCRGFLHWLQMDERQGAWK